MSTRTTVSPLKKRVHGIYSAMKLRFGPKYWKNGKRKGQLRVPGQDLPFSEAELLAGMEMAFPDGCAIYCPYCSSPIDSLSATLDHEIPIARGGSLGLENIGPVCASCNGLKGGLTPIEFRSLWLWILEQHPAAGADLCQRLRTGAMGMRLRYFGKKAK